MANKEGLMLVCDGSNGAGKTTVMAAIEKHLTEVLGREVVMTREPGGTVIGEAIRGVVLNPDTPEMSDITELFLFAAARAQHVEEKIKPAIEAGKIVVSDRFDSATKSFQHYARGLSLDVFNRVNNIALNGFKPDLNIILDLDPVIGMERVRSRGEGLDRMEVEKIDFLNRARQGFLAQAEEDPERFAVVDASQSVDQVISEVIAIIDRLIARSDKA